MFILVPKLRRNTRLMLEPDSFNMIKSAATLVYSQPMEKQNRWVQEFVRSDSPPPVPPPRPISPPIFARDSISIGSFDIHSTHHALCMNTVKDLVEQSFVSQVDLSDGFDMDHAHLVMVNGWRTSQSSYVKFTPADGAAQKPSSQPLRQHLLWYQVMRTRLMSYSWNHLHQHQKFPL